MKKNAKKRAARMVALATARPEHFERAWKRRLLSKLFEIHEVAGDLSVARGAFDVVDWEMTLLQQVTGDRQILQDAKSVLETEGIRAIRTNC
jgi:hypothetical protein